MPVLLGTNAEEMALSVPYVLTPFDYQAYVLPTFGLALGTSVLTRYPVFSHPSPQKALIAVMTDLYFACPARRLARTLASAQEEPVFRYSGSGLRSETCDFWDRVESP